MPRNPVLLKRKRSGLLVIDIQEKILAVMANSKQVVDNSVKLIKSFIILERPIFVTEQYPEGLGNTNTKVKKALGDVEIQEKLTFSCCGLEGMSRSIRAQRIEQIVLCGIESHVCVWQTAMDLMFDGLKVSVVRDAISSRTNENYEAALERMMANGIQITTTEMVLFELLRKAGTDEFKAISKLIK